MRSTVRFCAHYFYWLVPQKGLKALSTLVAYSQAPWFFSGHKKKKRKKKSTLLLLWALAKSRYPQKKRGTIFIRWMRSQLSFSISEILFISRILKMAQKHKFIKLRWYPVQVHHFQESWQRGDEINELLYWNTKHWPQNTIQRLSNNWWSIVHKWAIPALQTLHSEIFLWLWGLISTTQHDLSEPIHGLL